MASPACTASSSALAADTAVCPAGGGSMNALAPYFARMNVALASSEASASGFAAAPPPPPASLACGTAGAGTVSEHAQEVTLQNCRWCSLPSLAPPTRCWPWRSRPCSGKARSPPASTISRPGRTTAPCSPSPRAVCEPCQSPTKSEHGVRTEQGLGVLCVSLSQEQRGEVSRWGLLQPATMLPPRRTHPEHWRQKSTPRLSEAQSGCCAPQSAQVPKPPSAQSASSTEGGSHSLGAESMPPSLRCEMNAACWGMAMKAWLVRRGC